jgi:chaperonin GroES
MTKIEAINDRIVVKKVEPIAKQTKSGLYIPDEVTDKAKEKSRFGEVLSIGDKVKSCLKVGDVVIFGQFSGVAINDFNEDVHIIKEADIHGKINLNG